MKTTLVGINSKYIHLNLAIRYLKANCKYDIDLKEYIIKDDISVIIEDLRSTKSNIFAFSVYIWNIEIVKYIAKELRLSNPDAKIILGGPEVSYDSEYLIEDQTCDYIVYGEGEIAFNLLLRNIIDNDINRNDIPNLIFMEDNKVIHTHKETINNLDKLKNPYHFAFDEKDITNKIAYVELSRGCPYHCSYCLASVDNRLRYFSMERVIKDIIYLYNKGAKTFKFLDRSFNIKPKIAKQFFNYIINNNFKGAVFQFEINGDILDDNLIDYLVSECPENLIRFEIGIQSTNNKVNEAIHRYQNTNKLLSNIKKLSKSNISLHLDLIAGLPYEDLVSFINTFDTVFKLYAKELQLGFLKILKGTALSYETQNHDYNFSKLPPYEIIENKYLSQSNLQTVHIVEDVLQTYWNKGFMYNTMIYLLNDIDSPFKFLLELGVYLNQTGFSLHKYQLTELFTAIWGFAKEKYPKKTDILDYLKYDYLNHHNIKPKMFWFNLAIKKNEIIRKFHSQNSNYNVNDLYKYSLVTKYLDGYLIALYFPNYKELLIFKP